MSVEYAGADNLEVMQEAGNYNHFLADLVIESLAGVRNCVDFGAGSGTIARLVSARDVRVTCIEPDRGLRERLLSDRFEACASLADLAPDSVDAAYSLNVFEHIENDVDVLRELRRRLRRGAPCLIYVPAFPLLFSAMDRLVGHVRRYRCRELRDKLRASGFEVERIEFVDSLGFLAALAFKFLGRGDGRLSTGPVVTYDRYAFPISRALDRALKHVLGKNLFAIARRG